MIKEKNQLKIKIVTPEKVILKDFYDQATIPTTDGEIGVLPKHSPLVSGLKAGEIRLKKDNKTTYLAVSSGFVEVRPNSSVVILADTAEHAEYIDLERAEQAKKRAEELLTEQKHHEDVDYARLQSLLKKEIVRIKVGRRKK